MEKSPYELVQSFDENLWRQGLSALLVEHTQPALDALLRLLSDKAWRKREAAAKTLIEWGPEVIPAVVERLSIQNLDECYWLTHVLGHFDDPVGQEKIRELLANPDPEIRSYAVRAMSISATPAHAQILLPMLNDSNWAVRRLVFERLLSFGKTILPQLTAKVRAETEPNHSIIALYVKIGGNEIAKDLGELYQNGSFAMRYSIITALGESDSPMAVDFLINGLSDPSWVIRKRAAELLTSLGPKIFDRLSAWFPRGDSVMKHQIVSIIVTLLGERTIPLLRRLLASEDQEYRILAVESLSRLPGDEPCRLLIKCLTDPFRIVSDFASECLARKTNLNLDLLLEHLETTDENLRFLVIRTIGSIGGIALNPIIRILEEGNKQERLFLLGVLQKITPTEKLIGVLIQLLGDPSWPIRNAAANCLKSYGAAAVSAVVTVLNSPNEDVQFWSRRVLLGMGPAAVAALTEILDLGTDGALIPHIIAALLAMDHADAVPAVLKFLQANDDNRIQSIFQGIKEISSREVVETILNLISHPDERAARWLASLLGKVRKPPLRRLVLLGLNHTKDQCRLFVAEAIQAWDDLPEADLKAVVRQLEVERNPRNLCAIARILARFSTPASVNATKEFLKSCDPDLMLDMMLELAQSDRPLFGPVLAELLKTRSEVIRIEDTERVGKILGLIYRSRPEGILQGLQSPTMAFRLCCIVAIEQIKDKRVAFALMDNLNPHDDPLIIKRAVKILAPYFFSEDFRLKGAVTDYLLALGPIITDPLLEMAGEIENEIDRKGIVDLVESVGGQVDPTLIRKKGEARPLLSDDHLDQVLEKRKRAMEELQKYDKIIQQTHTQELTIMFTDVKGYTAFSSKASLSEVMAMLKQHDEILVPIIEKHEGKTVKKIGDAFLVAFEQATKGVLAAMEIQRRLKEYNLTVDEDRRLGLRIALNTGPVIRREGDVFGDTVNIASRLEGIADANEIVISEQTANQIDPSVFELIPFGEHTLKGIDKPIRAYKVNW
ncbi:MAG: Adenylate cyclase [Candidatus Ozemobacter sibiricus]|uniref:Adenylate cyclase n=1 Tax=Candidatus Ozemobacter sibiricus TaxID=2268124 RepID=A0A367ZJJ4_9BACT|nr:MAG: Adenylate cyclase [Candidatus Ozemobacter sibiricus]